MLLLQMISLIVVAFAAYLKFEIRESKKLYSELRTVSRRKSKSRKPQSGYIYFVCHKDRLHIVKIGRAKDIKNRMADFKTFAPYGLWLLGSVRCRDVHYTEKYLHQKFSKHRLRGEWFLVDIPLLLLIANVSKDSERILFIE